MQYKLKPQFKYSVEVYIDYKYSRQSFLRWLRPLKICEECEEENVDRAYTIGFNNINKARKFRARVKRELSKKLYENPRMFKVHFEVCSCHREIR